MKRQYSISLRLTFWFSCAFLTGFLIFGIFQYVELAESLNAGRDKTLSTRARRCRELLQSLQAESESRQIARFSDFTDATPEGNLIQVFDLHGQRIYPPARHAATNFPWPSGGNAVHYTSTQFQGRLFRVLTEPLILNSADYRLHVAGQLEDNKLLLGRFAGRLLWATPALLVMSALGGYFLSRRVLNPIAQLTASARSISIGNLRQRLPISHTGDELERLAETCNEMLARVEDSVNRITRFTADASHELRSPLTYIRTVSEYALRDPNLDADSAESFREIVRESEEATRLLEDMLTLARSDADRASLNFMPVDLAQVFLETYRKAQPVALAHGHALIMTSNATEPLFVTGDAASLRRLLWILVDNAIRYTRPGGRILLTLARVGAETRICVQDNGVGIPDSALPHIFDRFFRVQRDRNSEEGTGLGLAIAKWIADVHGVALSVQSAEDVGTTFQAVFTPLNATAI